MLEKAHSYGLLKKKLLSLLRYNVTRKKSI